MLFFPVSTPGTLEVYAPLRPDASPTVAVYDGNGSATVAATTSATRDSVETTTAGGTAVGDTQIALASTSGVVPGRRYLVGDAATEATEFVVVRDVQSTGNVVTLTTPLIYPHGYGESFDGTRISYTFTNAIFTAVGSAFKSVFTWANGSTTQSALEIDFAISKHALASRVQVVDLQVVDPQLLSTVGQYTDWTLTRAFALGELMSDIASRWEPWCLRGTTQAFERAHTWRWLALLSEHTGNDAKTDRHLARYQHTLDQVVTSPNVDRDQDNTIEPHEGGTRSGRLRFA